MPFHCYCWLRRLTSFHCQLSYIYKKFLLTIENVIETFPSSPKQLLFIVVFMHKHVDVYYENYANNVYRPFKVQRDCRRVKCLYAHHFCYSFLYIYIVRRRSLDFRLSAGLKKKLELNL